MDADSFHRLTKVLLDSGEAATVAQAQAAFAAYGVRVIIAPDAFDDPCNRIIAMTVLNISARTFQGNVAFTGPMDAIVDELAEPITLERFAEGLGLNAVESNSTSWPTIFIGPPKADNREEFICPWASGWLFGLGPAPSASSVFAPAAVAAAGLAVNEAFSLLRGDNPYAGRRAITMSLWNPADPASNGPREPTSLPAFWMVGLGHLGQAYAWILGLMDARPSSPIYLQDADHITKSTVSTSILTAPLDVGQRKTRVVANWLERRGYQTALVERRYDEFQRLAAGEPRIALFGVDNVAARRHIESAGFRLAIDAGLGAGYRDFRGIRVRTFPGPSRASDLWAAGGEQALPSLAPAYKDLLTQGADACGVTMLASRAVGAPFVGCVAAAFVIAELIRSSVGAQTYAVTDLNLREPSIVDAETSPVH